MLAGDLVNSGAIPALEMMLRFAGRRQTLIANEIANLSTPGFERQDVSVADFQRRLGEAIDRRRERTGGERGRLDFESSREVRVSPRGDVSLTPLTPTGGILFHDRNNRDLERTMQDLAENVGVFRIASDLLRQRFEHLRSAISERA